MPAKAHKPTSKSRAEAGALASFGVPQEAIAAFIGVSHPTLRKHYGKELNLSSIKANLQVGKYLFSLASGQAISDGATHGDCKAAAMFWAKTRMGWRENHRLEGPGPNGEHTINHAVSDDLRAALDAIAGKIAGGDEPG